MPVEMLEAMYEIVDRCATQHWCESVLHNMNLMAIRKHRRIYHIVTTPGHGKSKIDSEYGRAKTQCDFVYSQDPLLAEEDPYQ